jgi:hypothetical protein
MSASGQKRTFRDFGTTSALPPKADIGTQLRDVRFVPIADIGHLFDHLVGAYQQALGNRKAELLRRFEIDH